MNEVITETRHWLGRIVIGLNLCPFAEQPFKNDRIGYAVCAGESTDEIYRDFVSAIERLLDPEQGQETALLIVSNALSEFDDYLDLLALLEQSIEEAGLAGLIQLASFHPHYRFDGAADDDPANFSNRSPYPMFHLIREDLMEKALAFYPDPEQIPERNIACLRALGVTGISALLDD